MTFNTPGDSDSQSIEKITPEKVVIRRMSLASPQAVNLLDSSQARTRLWVFKTLLDLAASETFSLRQVTK